MTTAAKSSKGFGLVANGSSGAWEVAIEQTIKGPERWFAEIEGPAVCLFFELADREIIEQILTFLANGSPRHNGRRRSRRENSEDSLTIGQFGRSPVSLVRDDEFPDRCFLVIGPTNKASVRVTLAGEHLQDFLAAIRETHEEMG